MNDFDKDPELNRVLRREDPALDGQAFTRELMLRLETERRSVTVPRRWIRPAALSAAAVLALVVASPGLELVAAAIMRGVPASDAELARLLGISAVAVLSLLAGLAPVANSIGESLAERRSSN